MTILFTPFYEKYGEDFPWWVPEDPSPMERELRRELVPGHPLYGKEPKALARSSARDDVLFTDGIRFFIVHLTWGRGSERFPQFWEFQDLEGALSYIEQDFLY